MFAKCLTRIEMAAPVAAELFHLVLLASVRILDFSSGEVGTLDSATTLHLDFITAKQFVCLQRVQGYLSVMHSYVGSFSIRCPLRITHFIVWSKIPQN